MELQKIHLLSITVILILVISFAASNAFISDQLEKANRQAIIQDMHNLAALAKAFYNTPANMGGGSRSWNVDRFYIFSGYTLNNNGKRLITSNGEIGISSIESGKLVITGYGNDTGFDEKNSIQGNINLTDSHDDDIFSLLN